MIDSDHPSSGPLPGASRNEIEKVLGPRKRSFTIRGHRTSLSLEDPFWECLAELAEERGVSVTALVTEIDESRGRVGLSSAIRTFVLDALRTELRRARAESGSNAVR